MIPKVIKNLHHRLIRFSTRRIYGRWPERPHLDDGYTMLLPIPADMPFLLRFALEGLRYLHIPNCKRIAIVSDGAGPDDGIRTIIAESGDKRVCNVPLTRTDRILVNFPRVDGSANYRYFTMVLRGMMAAKTDAVYLHDADAFWLEEGGVETQYREFRERGMHTLGVTSRIDPMFKERGFEIPGTWECMVSRSWVRSRAPADIRGGWHLVPGEGWRWFDNLLYGQYLDYPSGKFGLMANPPKFVHFYATITEYRCWQRARHSRATEDQLFCLLLLSLLAEVIPGARRDMILPQPHELARGLLDPSATITYLANTAPKRYTGFRKSLAVLCSCPVFANVAGRIRDLVAPFDEHFQLLVNSGTPATDARPEPH